MKIRRNTFVVATAALLITVAGCSSSEDSSSRVKNAALPAEPVLINGSFSKGGKGWNLGRSNALVGDGCAVGTSGDPSMGKQVASKLVFGKTPREVMQTVTVPEPGKVTVSFSAEVPAAPAGAARSPFEVIFQLRDSSESPSDTSTKSKTFSLSVTTTRAYEQVNIMIFGWNASGRAGCSGASVSNASLSFVKTPATTSTTTAVAKTTTTLKATTTTSTTSTTTTVKATTTAPPATPAALGTCTVSKCNIGDTGPSGGVVFITPTTPGNATGNFFEVSRSVSAEHKWGCAGKVLGNSGAAIGDGRANTARMLARCTTDNAVREARARTKVDGDGPGIWFLPSTNELLELHRNKALLDSISVMMLWGGQYWTSTELDATKAQIGILGRTTQVIGSLSKTSGFDVKLISMFKPDLTPLLVLGPKQDFNLNDIGPAGGRIFITPSTPGNTTGKYFEAAQKDWSGKVPEQFSWLPTKWACDAASKKLVGATATAIGTGAANTRLVDDTCASAPASEVFAIRTVSQFRINERSDWFLPSKDEHTALYRSITGSNVDIGLLWDFSGTRSFNACVLSSTEFSKDIVYGSYEREMAAGGQEYATQKTSTAGCPWPVREVIEGEIGYRPL